MDFMAVPAKLVQNGELVAEPTTAQLQDVVAKLYGRGFKRSDIARALLPYLTAGMKNPRTDEERLQHARSKLRRWEHSSDFRDLVYQYAVVKVDMGIPEVLEGVFRKAKRGRVDAAKLLLEITGRHSSKEATAEANVTVQIANLPRPE
jgi:hypothetical protein